MIEITKLAETYPFIKLKKNGGYRINKQSLVIWFHRNYMENIPDGFLEYEAYPTVKYGSIILKSKWYKPNIEALKNQIYNWFDERGICLLSSHLNELIEQVKMTEGKAKRIK